MAAAAELVIVIGGFVNGLGLVRSLAALGCRIIVITTQAYDMAQHSSHVSEHHHLHDLDHHPEGLAALLERHAQIWKGALVLPTSDAAIAGLDACRGRLRAAFRLAIPPSDCVPYLLDRTRMLEAASAVGILSPVNYGRATELKLDRADFRFPVVVKPLRSGEFSSMFGKKLFVVRSASDFGKCCEQLARAGVDGQVFDLIPGPDSDIYVHCVYIDQHGRPLAECMVRKLRQSPPHFGVARVAELTDNISRLSEQSSELLRRIGFRGFAATEFKFDRRDGSYRFMEVNGRSVIYNSLLRQGRLDIAKLMLAEHLQGRAEPVETVRWPGVWVHLHADLLRSLQNWRREGLTPGDYAGPYRREKTFAVWSAGDPKPFLAQWSHSFRKACSAVLRINGRNDSTGNTR